MFSFQMENNQCRIFCATRARSPHVSSIWKNNPTPRNFRTDCSQRQTKVSGRVFPSSSTSASIRQDDTTERDFYSYPVPSSLAEASCGKLYDCTLILEIKMKLGNTTREGSQYFGNEPCPELSIKSLDAVRAGNFSPIEARLSVLIVGSRHPRFHRVPGTRDR